jgi:hypothetical protein
MAPTRARAGPATPRQDDVDDFALSPGTLDSPVFPTLLSLMYQWRPYRVHTGFLRLHYRF